MTLTQPSDPVPPPRQPIAAEPPPPAFAWDAPLQRRGRLRMQSLLLLRWIALLGQIVIVAVYGLMLGAPMPWPWVLGVIAAGFLYNLALTARTRG